ncbi:glycosyltransferase [Nocardioides humi]|uniref:Glycosyltransferase family 4 protein n=1 Tax=Nocardioides humi TaxID=449461 RepID=A0ABN2ATD1_9ACTN|nr:glycosyltransferase [Nocardioides humi]
MRLLSVISELGVGGAEVVAVRLAIDAAAQGHDVRVASTPGFRVAELEDVGVAHLPLRLVGRRPADLVGSLRRLRSVERPDLVHAHNPKPSVLARLAFPRRTPIVTTLHGVDEAEAGRAARILARTSDRVVVVAPHLAEQLERHGYPAARIDVVTNGVPAPPAYPRDEARRELGLRGTEVAGLCLARMVDQKRHDLLLDAWARLERPATLLLAGDGPRRARLEEQASRLGLGPRVRFLGPRSDVPRLLAAADLMVLPTDWEGLPISVLEALGAGVPVVASAVPGIVDHFAGAVRMARPGSVPALARALDEVTGDRAVRAALGDRGRAVFRQRFDADRMVARYREIHARVLGAPACAGMTTEGMR